MMKPDISQWVGRSETQLFHVSAVTFNAHRIHYDLPYAQQVEKYRGLVVHGPLVGVTLAQMGASKEASAR